MAILPKIAVNGNSVVTTKTIMAGSIPTGVVTTKIPTGIVHGIGGSTRGKRVWL